MEFEHALPIETAFKAYTTYGGNYIKGGDYSVTDLITPPRIVHLRNRHKDELPPETVDDTRASFIGTAVHSFLDKNLRKSASIDGMQRGWMMEQKFWDKWYGRKIAGKFDVYNALLRILWDFKVTGTWKVMRGDHTEWEQQLNIYAWFLTHAGFPVDEIRIIAINLDWDKWGPMRDPQYPKHWYTEIPLDLWLTEEQESFIDRRVKALVDSEDADDEHLPLCSDEDRWYRDEVFAIMEPSKAKAGKPLRSTRNAPTLEKAEEYVAWREEQGKPLAPDYEIVHRPGIYARCADYCRVRGFCSQYGASN